MQSTMTDEIRHEGFTEQEQLQAKLIREGKIPAQGMSVALAFRLCRLYGLGGDLGGGK